MNNDLINEILESIGLESIVEEKDNRQIAGAKSVKGGND